MGWRDTLAGWLGASETKGTTLVAPGTAGWFDLLAGRTGSKSGQTVTIKTALEVTAWLCGTRVIAEGLAQVPCKLVKTGQKGEREEARDHPLFMLLYRRPNAWQTSFEFREQIAFHLVLCGNAFVVIVRDSMGRVIELLPYEPGAVTVTRNNDMTLSYRVNLVDGSSIAVPDTDMWHIKGPSWNGWLGLDAVNLARNALGLALAAEEFGSELFANGARPSGILTTDSGAPALTPEQVAQLAASWQAAQVGTGQRLKTAILSGVKWQPLSSNADEAQFIEARKFAVVEVARSLRVNPIMLMHQDGTASYASVEQMFLAHATHTLGPWFERFEQSAEVNLLTDRELKDGYSVELVDAGLVRGTAKERAETMAILRQNGVITPNEWRDAEDYSRITGDGMDEAKPAANLYGGDMPAPVEAVKSDPLSLTVNVAPSPVTVNTPPVTFKADAPVVNVSPPEVTVNTPEVKVAAPKIDVHMHKGGRQVKHIEYDADGNVSRIVEDDAE